MKIAQVTPTFPPYMAGTGNVCFYNSLELAKLGHDVTVFTSRFPDEEYDYPNLLKVKRLKPTFRIGNTPFIPQLMMLEEFDIVHLHYPFIFGIELILLNSLLKKNIFIVTYHQDLIYDGVFLNYLVKGYNYLIRDRVLSKAKKILTPSMDHLIGSSIKHIVKEREHDVVELPNGVDTEKFNSDITCDEIKKKHSLRDEKVILFVGALDKAHQFKGVEILIKAFSKLKYKKAILMIVGEGGLKGYYQNLAKGIGVSKKTIFTGRVPDHDLQKYYALSDLLVLPSTTRGEIFGLVLVEAMACGKPVIATKLPGVRTVVDNEKNGFLVEPKNVEDLANKIEYLLENENIAKKFGREGRIKVKEKYSWSKIGKKLESIYLEVLSS
ncbi:MAG: glycosyltransferase family 4 protein [Methanophagales archaeon]|nr:glycosyltransferase family 4 protein [Methanophagales archaeon]